MSSFVVAKNALTTNQILDNLDHCKNTTVGSNKYQLYCLSNADLDGSCVLLPSRYMTNGAINCYTVTSQKFLEQLYEDTGNSCAINCYYPITQVQIPEYTYSYSYSYKYSYSYDAPDYRTTLSSQPTASALAGAGTQTASALPTAGTGSASAANSSSSASQTAVSLPASGSATMNPNFLFTFIAVFAIMLMFVRKAI